MECDENDWREKVVAISTHPQHLYRLCEFCDAEIPHSGYDDHTETCPGYQSRFADTSVMMTAQESDKNSSSDLVIGRASRESGRSRQPTNVAYIAPDEEYSSLVEIQLPTALQVTNNHAPSRLVVGTTLLSSNELQRIFPPSVDRLYTEVVSILQDIHEQLKTLLHELLEIIESR